MSADQLPETRSMIRFSLMRGYAKFALEKAYSPPTILADAQLNEYAERLVADRWPDDRISVTGPRSK